MVTENLKNYLGGFFDGDGNITIEKLKDSGYCLRIKFFQSDENWIDTIKTYYPFLKKTNNSRKSENSRIQYELRAAGKQIEPLVDDLLKYSILKYEQLLYAKKYFSLINVKDKTAEKEEIYKKLKELKKCSNLKPYERLNKQYISGFFDAEGSIGVYSSTLRVKITQKSDTVILQKIADMYNNKNKIDNYAISFYGKNSCELLNDLSEYCIYKKPQILAALDYTDTYDCELTDDIRLKRKEYVKIISDEKRVDVVTSSFETQESHQDYLYECFDEFYKFSYTELLNYCKMIEIENTNTVTKFENKIYNRHDWSDFNIDPVLEFCESNRQIQLYQYFRKKVSSLPSTGVVGRAIRILVKDTVTDKYIGIMCLSSDVYTLGDRDLYIKKTANLQDTDWKNKYLKNIMNLSCCVPLQPFGFNTTGGKLLACLAFSKEVFDYYFLKYKEPLLAIITTSINGKSIQYDRLKCLKMIGYTKGYGSVNIPDSLYRACQEYNNIYDVVKKSNRIDRFNFLKNILSHLGLPQNILQHNNKRGIYFGYLFTSKLDIEYDLDELQSVNDIYTSWKNRWCMRRIENLLSRNAIKNTTDLYTTDSFRDCKKFQLPEKRKRVTQDDLIKEVLTYKSKEVSQEQVCVILNDKYYTNLNTSDISRIYTGKTQPEIIDDEYIKLFNTKLSKNKLRDDEIYFILDLYKNTDYSYSNIADELYERFTRKITPGTVCDIVHKKVKPVSERKIPEYKNMDAISKFKLLTEDQIMSIAKMKQEKKSTQEVSDFVKMNYNVFINRDCIRKLWTGEDLQLSSYILKSEEYKTMWHKKKEEKPRKTWKKITEEQTEYLLNFKGSADKCCVEFKKKFDKTIKKSYIYQLKHKTKANCKK